MNRKLPYEQLIAEKMQQLPLPDADQSWQDMKKLLDREMPVPHAGGRNGFGTRKWWWMGTAILILVGGLILSTQWGKGDRNQVAMKLEKKGSDISANSNSVSKSVNSSNNQNSSSIDNNSTLKNNLESTQSAGSTSLNAANEGSNQSGAGNVGKNASASSDLSKDASGTKSSSVGLKSDKSNQSTFAKSVSATHEQPDKTIPLSKPASSGNPGRKTGGSNSGGTVASDGNTTLTKTGLTASSISNGGIPAKSDHYNAGKPAKGLSGKTIVGSAYASGSGSRANSYGAGTSASGTGSKVQQRSGTNDKTGYIANTSGLASTRSASGSGKKANPAYKSAQSKGGNDILSDHPSYSGHKYDMSLIEVPASQNYVDYTDRNKWGQWAGFDDINIRTINRNFIPYASNMSGGSYPTKLSVKDVERKLRREEKMEKRAEAKENRKPFLGEKTDRFFAAGLAPYQNFAISSQEAYNYNSSANKGIATDYIPAPYMQFHLTDKVYLLGEFQFNFPQATSSVLLSQKLMYQPGTQNIFMQDIYLRKLYYFNMPLSFYYSPRKNFYLGSGLQFSSLNSGIAYLEQKNTNNELLYSETFKIKDDSLSAKLTGSEWRYLFDANYYWNRFMFGFRYTQAFSDYVNMQVNNTAPPSQARNQAFQLYFRYNIIVSGRKSSQYDPLKY